MASEASSKRVGNRRGFGSGLRDEIVDAADRLLASSGSREAVTLRAIAREAGIAAPSIYPHFTDRDAVLDAVVTRTFRALAETCEAASVGAQPGMATIEAISAAYLEFARERPGQYRVLFERSPANIASPPHPYEAGLAAFDLLVRALGDVAPAPEADRQRDAQVIFAALHGVATLRPALPGFPWQDETALIGRIVGRAASRG